MPIFLDHTIVPAHDKEESARFFARIMGLEYKGLWGHFAPVKVNECLPVTVLRSSERAAGFEPSHVKR